MILYYMKKEALEFVKKNINNLYTHYFTDDTPDWISEEYGSDAFAVFKEIPDFELCEISEKAAGEIDFENIQRLFLAMKELSESQAAEERLWAGLCNKTFYEYLRRRWRYDETDITDSEKDSSTILSRFFFSSGARSSYFRNSLAKYWWVGRLSYDETNVNDSFYALKVIGSSDLNSKITEIFYNNTFASNPIILKAITKALGYYYEKGIYLSEKDVLRPTMQYLNAVGGALCLDAIPESDFVKITVDKINSLLRGGYSALTVDENDNSFDEIEENEEELEAPIIAPDVVDTLSYDFEYEEPTKYVCKGNRVKLFIEDLNKEHIVIVPKDKEIGELNLIESLVLGKSIGDIFFVARHKYIIREID